jgi:hypothetical protein
VLAGSRDERWLDLFDARGAPERSISLRGAPRAPRGRVRYGRRWIVLSSYSSEALLVSLPDGTLSAVRAQVGTEGTLHAFDLSPDQKELWCATLEPAALHRFALPE